MDKSKKNKIILLNDIGFSTPHGRIAWIKKMNYFAKNGYDISIITNKNGKKYYKDKINAKKYYIIKKNNIPKTKIGYLYEVLIRNIIAGINFRSINFDYIYSLATLDNLLFPFFVKIFNPKIKIFIQFDNIVPLNDPGNKIYRFLAWIFFKISLLLLRRADTIFAISPELKKYLIRHNFDPSKIIITGNAIEINLIKISKPQKIKYDGLFIGRINETKGIFDMLEVVNQVKKEIPNFKLAIMGEGDVSTKNKFKNKIKSLKLSKNIILLGTRNGLEKFSIIKSSKIFIFLSKSESESFGIALLEAVSCGLPAFVYDLPAYKNIYLNNEVNVFKKGDINSVSQAIIQTFKNKQFKNQNGQNLLGKYSWENIASIEFKAFKLLF